MCVVRAVDEYGAMVERWILGENQKTKKNLLQCQVVQHEFHVMSSRTEPKTPVSAWTMRNWIYNFEKKTSVEAPFCTASSNNAYLTTLTADRKIIHSVFHKMHLEFSFTFKLLQMTLLQYSTVYDHDSLRSIKPSWMLESIFNVKSLFGSKTLRNTSNKNIK